MFDLNTAQIFESVARHASLSKAAKDLSVAVSTIGRKIDELERTLGVILLQRDTRSCKLTAAGEDFAHYCKQALLKIEQGHNAVQRYHLAPHGTVRVMALPGMTRAFIAPNLHKLWAQHPDIQVELSPYSFDAVVDAHVVDIALRSFMPEDSTTVVRLVGRSALGIFASPGFLKHYGPIRTLADVTRKPHAALLHNKHSQRSYALAPNNLTHAKADEPGAVALQPVLASTDSYCLLEAALSDAVVTCLPHWLAKPYVATGCLQHLLPEVVDHAPIYTACASAAGLPQRVRIVLDFLHQTIGPRLAVTL